MNVFLFSSDVYRKSHDEMRLPNAPPSGPAHQTQDLVVGIAPLKLVQNSPLLLTKGGKIRNTDHELNLGEGEYRSLQLEDLKFAEEERGEGKESASFPLTYSKRLEAKKRMRQQIAEKKGSELISPPSQREANHEEELAWRELQQKVHALEHVYNQECFLKVHACTLGYQRGYSVTGWANNGRGWGHMPTNRWNWGCF